jgi:hypothetical protein
VQPLKSPNSRKLPKNWCDRWASGRDYALSFTEKLPAGQDSVSINPCTLVINRSDYQSVRLGPRWNRVVVDQPLARNSANNAEIDASATIYQTTCADFLQEHLGGDVTTAGVPVFVRALEVRSC